MNGAYDVGDMDTVEHLSRLDDAFRGTVLELFQRPAPRAIYAGQPEDHDGDVMHRANRDPFAFGFCTGDGAVALRVDRRFLIDPGTVMISIDADGGEIDHPLRARCRDVICMLSQYRVAVSVRRNGNQQAVALLQKRGYVRSRHSPIKDHGPDTIGAQFFGLVLRTHGARNIAAVEADELGKRQRGIPQPETEKLRHACSF